jgi:hypothetical protein
MQPTIVSSNEKGPLIEPSDWAEAVNAALTAFMRPLASFPVGSPHAVAPNAITRPRQRIDRLTSGPFLVSSLPANVPANRRWQRRAMMDQVAGIGGFVELDAENLEK